MNKVKIGQHWIGKGQPCFIIAEVGANHNRNFKQALELIDVAAEAGADAVKFQTYSAETLYSKKTPQFSYLKQLEKNKNTYEIIKENELPREWHGKLAKYAKKKGLIFISTPFDKEAIDQLDRIGVLAYKWASFEIVDLPLLRYAAYKGKPMILSTGMCNLADIQEAVDTVYLAGNKKIILLQCTSLYPTKPEQVNLRMMDAMREVFQIPVGLSDHTLGISVPIAAVARGACVIEKHFTLNRRLKGPDHSFALEPDELKEMIKAIREVEVVLGSSKKRMLPEEKEMAKLGRRSIIAKMDIPKGTKITYDMLICKRPGLGIKPKFLNIIIGKTAKIDVEKDDIITWKNVLDIMVKQVSFREAAVRDCKVLWQWRNEPTVRKVSFNKKFVPYSEHQKWFTEKLENRFTKILIILGPQKEKIGQIRYEIDYPNRSAEVNIILDKKYRGEGIGSAALKLTAEYVIKAFDLNKVVAYIKKVNVVSMKAFKKAGFVDSKEVRIKNQLAIKMKKHSY